MIETRVISAKISPELLKEMDEIQSGLGIKTRNELIIRAIRLYSACYRFGLSHADLEEG